MLWTLPIVGALLGWLTNWVAVKMLFRPRRPVQLLWWKLQGLIPSRKKALAVNVAAAIDEQLISSTDFSSALRDKRIMKSVRKAIMDYMKDAIDNELRPAVELIPLMKSTSWLDKLANMVTSQLMHMMPDIAGQLGDKLKDTIDFKSLIAEKIDQFTDDELEEVVMSIASRELRSIEYWGLLIGGVVGGLQWLLLTLV